MPKTLYVPEDARRSGVDITWTPTANRISVGGWYDSCVGIEGEAFTLREFFDRLGITEAHCRKVFREPYKALKEEAE